MDKYKEKELDALIDRVMGETPMDSPSKNFTKNLMSKIEAQTAKEVLQYKPLLPKKVLTAIVAVFIAAFILGLTYYAPKGGQSWFPTVDFDPYFEKAFGWMKFYTSSKAALYAIVLFGVMFLVQFPWLKRYIDRHGALG